MRWVCTFKKKIAQLQIVRCIISRMRCSLFFFLISSLLFIVIMIMRMKSAKSSSVIMRLNITYTRSNAPNRHFKGIIYCRLAPYFMLFCFIQLNSKSTIYVPKIVSFICISVYIYMSIQLQCRCNICNRAFRMIHAVIRLSLIIIY